ncbi:MAG: hypothetical protein CVT79_07340 [Alphaproteobacteria bacterium HGW-Alphaproteobacteria-18]|nr:MAG: hypothetical protein CVT79_07340 [Alphaproteobacteria bacterium HGW-Alphaproteobacteria-18]
MSLAASNLLAPVGEALRGTVIKSYSEIVSRYAHMHWEPAELNGGKFCEAVYCVLKAALDGDFSVSPTKPKNFKQACEALEKYPVASTIVGERSIRILIPRVLIPLYDIRNNRGVGHIGGDVDPNFMDATLVMHQSSWVMAELVRVFHAVSTAEAQAAVKQLTALRHPLIWQTSNGLKRVLRTDLGTADKILTLLYGESTPVKVSDLQQWTSYKNSSNFKKIILRLQDKLLVEYDSASHTVELSPLGATLVEDKDFLGANISS